MPLFVRSSRKNKQVATKGPISPEEGSIRNEWVSLPGIMYRTLLPSPPGLLAGSRRSKTKSKKTKLRIACCFEVHPPRHPVARKSNKQQDISKPAPFAPPSLLNSASLYGGDSFDDDVYAANSADMH